jgi:predicted transcriptional regulator
MDLKLCDSDFKFMEVVWEHAPVRSGELAKLCADALGWKKPTTYTIIRKMSEKGFIRNENAVVTVLIEKERCQRAESEYVVESRFGGSLPSFVAAFLGNRSISEKDAEELRDIVDKLASESGEE